MKKVYIFFILKLFFSLLTSAQWSGSSFPSGFDINAIYFTDNNNGFAGGVGIAGMFNTTDGGNTWVNKFNQPSDSSYYKGNKYNSIYFINNSIGFAAGWNGFSNAPMIVKTINGGINWNMPFLGSFAPVFGDSYLNSIVFKDPMNGFAVGTAGMLMVTTDGGNTWTKRNLNLTLDLNSIIFIDINTGFIAGEEIILKTIDGGITWTSKNTSNVTFTDIKFADSNTGYAAGYNGAIFKSTDNGNSWNRQNNFFSSIFRSIAVIDKDTVYIAANDYIYKTTSGGNFWEQQPTSFTGKQMFAIHFLDSQKGIALGEDGKYLKTFNGGGSVAPFARFNVLNNPVCEDSVISFSNQGPSSYSYTWLVNNQIKSNSFNFSTTLTGNSNISLIANHGSYSDTSSQTISPLSAKLNKTIKTRTASYYCENYGGGVIYVDSTELGVNYQLRIDGNLGVSQIGNGGTLTLSPDKIKYGSLYEVVASKTNACGTSNTSKTITLTIYEEPNPYLTAIPSQNMVCYGDSAYILVLNSQKTVTYSLPDFNNDRSYYGYGNGDTLKLPTGRLIFNTSFLVEIRNACEVSPLFTPKPNINISTVKADFTIDKSLCPLGDSIHLSNNSTGSIFNWQFTPDGNHSSSNLSQPPPITFNSPGIKTIKLQVMTSIGCKDSITRTVKVAKPGTISSLTLCDSLIIADYNAGFQNHNVTDMVIDKWGNKYITGYCYPSTGNNGVFLFLYKIGPDNKLKWTKHNYPQLTNYSYISTTAVGLETDTAGNIYLAGMFSSRGITFGNVYFGDGLVGPKVYVVKLDTTGNLLWSIYGVPNSNDFLTPTDIKIKGESLFISVFNSSLVEYRFPGQVKTIGGSGVNVIEVDLNGNYKSDFLLMGGSSTVPIKGFLNPDITSVETNSIVGLSPKMVNDCQGNLNFITSVVGTAPYQVGTKKLQGPLQQVPSGTTQTNPFIAVYNEQGEWDRTIEFMKIIDGGGSRLDYIKLLSIDEFGNKYIAGSWYNDNSGATTNASMIIIANDTIRTFKNSIIIKIDLSGNLVWYTLSDGTRATGLELLNNKLVVYGTMDAVAIFGSRTDEDRALKSNGGRDAYLAIYNLDGALNNVYLIGDGSEDFSMNMGKDNNGNIYFLKKNNMRTGPTLFDTFFSQGLANIQFSKINLSGICNTNGSTENPTCGNFSGDSIIIVAPGSGKLCTGDSMKIQWASWGISFLDITYSIDSGKTYNTIAQNIPAANQYFTWSIPSSFNNSTKDIVLKIASGSSSDSILLHLTFHIQHASLANIDTTYYLNDWGFGLSGTPAGGTYLLDNKITSINFSPYAIGLGSYVLSYTVDNGACFSSNNYPITIRETRPVYRLKFSGNITGAMQCEGSYMKVEWTSSGVNAVDLNYSIDSGKTFIPMVQDYPASSGTYLWSFPSSLPQMLVFLINDHNNTLKADTLYRGDITFTRNNPPMIRTSTLYDLHDAPQIVLVYPGGKSSSSLTGDGIQCINYCYIYPIAAGVGNHKIIYTIDNYFCLDSTSLIYTVVDTLTSSITNKSIQSKLLNIYPDPSSGTFYIDLGNLNNPEGSFLVLDLLGKEVLRGELFKSKTLVELPQSLTGGIYAIIINLDNISLSQKIIISK
jgi:photosystem II stability/assembly factor-like uncharacterized protein